MFCHLSILGQNKIPLQIENNTAYNDEDIYIAIVGMSQQINGQFVFLDIQEGVQKPMDRALNTMDGPEGEDYNQGPDGQNRYADIFVKLSDIQNNTILIEAIQSARIFFALEHSLFLFFHCAGPDNCTDQNGNVVGPGYTSPDPSNPSDPNRDIIYEIIELNIADINGDLVFHGNTSRVDAFQYPIGLEITGTRGSQIVGEIGSKDFITTTFMEEAPEAFQGCLDQETGVITAPSKTPEYKEGVGVYADYFQPYINRVWEKYKNYELVFKDGDGLLWRGKCKEKPMIVVCDAPGSTFDGHEARIEKRPNTQEVLEGKGVFNLGIVSIKEYKPSFVQPLTGM